MPNCKFTDQYDNYEIRERVDFNCQELPLVSGFCIFHDKDYVQDKTNNEEHKRAVLHRLKRKVNHAISYSEPLLCIGFQLPEFSLSDLSIISKEFIKPIYFDNSQFFGKAFFDGANFQGEAGFRGANFKQTVDFNGDEFEGEADFFRAEFEEGANFYIANFKRKTSFYNSEFYGKTYFSGQFDGEAAFNYVLFEGKEKVTFDIENLSNVSFMNTDLTGVRFSDEAIWGRGGEDTKEDIFKTLDERLLEEEIKDKEDNTTKDFNLGSIKAVYRSLRENYEYRMRYDEAGQFFIREMELKRKYREVISSKDDHFEVKVKQNNWFRRNLFSLTGWYYHLSRYGESIWRPTVAGMVIVILSTLFWLIQINPSAEPSFINTVGFANATKITVWQRAFERSMADFLPLLSIGAEVKVGLIDFIIKIVGGAVTFGLIAIALRRRFERRYRH